jgi:DNA topoisomerase VI subunit B
MTGPSLNRTTFKTSRLAEFCSQKELINQTGHDVEQWPLVVLKELVDNSIDGCEEVGTAPAISISVADQNIIIADNGPGLPPGTVESILDYTARVSSREAYVSPTRGAQGNALKTILAMAFALDGESGETLIEAQGVAHRVTFSIDRIRREPKITHVREVCPVKIGTRITVRWPDSACSELDDAKARFLQIVDDFTWINPHLTLSIDWNRPTEDDDSEPMHPAKWSIPASNPGWTKWRPSDPTSAHWYDEARLERLIAAYVAHEQDRGLTPRTVREFISEFRGLSGTAKQKAVLDAVAASRMSLSEFFGNGDRDAVVKLLAAMQTCSRPIKPKDLGPIGKDHLLARFEAAGVAPESFDYRRAEIDHDGVPYLVEFAFGYCPNGTDRRIITGVNWSGSVGSNPFRNLGSGGESLDSILAQQGAGRDEPIVTVLHLACPRIEYLDRGKSSIVVPGSRPW